MYNNSEFQIGDEVMLNPEGKRGYGWRKELLGLAGKVIEIDNHIAVDFGVFLKDENGDRITHSCHGQLRKDTGRFFMSNELVPSLNNQIAIYDDPTYAELFE